MIRMVINKKQREKLQPGQDYVFESRVQTPGTYLAAALVNYQKKKPLFTRVVNTSNHPIKLQAGSIIGRIAAIGNADSMNVEDELKDDQYHQPKSEKQKPIANFDEQIEQALEGSVLHAKQQEQLRQLLHKYQDRFASNPLNPGTTDVIVHGIDTGEAKPVKVPPSRGSPEVQETIRKAIIEMKEAGVIEPSRSPWSSRVVLVKKKDGTPRFCVDYRDLNRVTVKDSYPIPYQTDLMDSISNAKYFSSLDLASGYWQIKLDEDAKSKSAFVTRFGLYQFNVMPFGLTNAPATFQRLMDLVLAGLTWIECMVYLDDIIIFSNTWKEHLERLEHVLQRLREFKLVAKLSKCQFGRRSIKFLGHIISAEGIGTDPDKIAAIKKLPYPKKDITEIRSFLGLVGYYRRFIPNYADIAEPLHQLLKKNSKREWTDECNSAVDQFKAALLSAPILRRPDFSKPFQIICDASSIGVGAILEQLDEEGDPHPIYYWSHTLNPAERNYSTTERECLAVVLAIKQFRHYVGGSRFTVFTDHSALKHLQTAKDLSGRLQRWSLALQEYQFEIHYRKGMEQGSADGLSRLGHQSEGQVGAVRIEQEDEEEESENIVIQYPYDPRIVDYDTADRWDVLELRKIDAKNTQVRKALILEQKQDPFFSLLRKRWLNEHIKSTPKPPPLTELERRKVIDYPSKHFTMINDLLYRKQFDKPKDEMIYQICIPKPYQEDYIQSLHDNPYGGCHLGINKCWDKLRNRYWWPKSYTELAKWIKSCPKCQRRKSRQTRAPLQPNLQTSKPWECVCVDVLGPLPPTAKHKYRYIIVFVDHFTSYVEAAPMKKNDATTCAEQFINLIICRYGSPTHLLSDGGSPFLSTLAQEINRIMNVKKLNTSAYHPQTNGKVERFNNTLVNMLAMYVSMKQNDWDKFIPYALFAYNTSRHELNQSTPYYSLFGREATYPIDAMVRTDSDTFLSVGKYTRKVIRRMRRAHHIAERNQRVIANKYSIASMAKPPPSFQVNDLVLMRFYVPEKKGSRKFLNKWSGPYEIMERLAPVTYRIRLPEGEGKRSLDIITNVNRLKRFYPREEKEETESLSTREHLLEREIERSTRNEAVTSAADRAEAETQSD